MNHPIEMKPEEGNADFCKDEVQCFKNFEIQNEYTLKSVLNISRIFF